MVGKGRVRMKGNCVYEKRGKGNGGCVSGERGMFVRGMRRRKGGEG